MLEPKWHVSGFMFEYILCFSTFMFEYIFVFQNMCSHKRIHFVFRNIYLRPLSFPPPTLGAPWGGERNCSYNKRACYLQQFSSTQGLINPARPPVILRRVRNNDSIIVFFLLCNWDISGCCGSIATLAHGAAGHWTFVEPTTPYTAYASTTSGV